MGTLMIYILWSFSSLTCGFTIQITAMFVCLVQASLIDRDLLLKTHLFGLKIVLPLDLLEASQNLSFLLSTSGFAPSL